MKKVLGNILITIIIWTGASLASSAQNDSLPPIPLYENATSKNAPSPDNRNVVSVASDNATLFADNELRKFYNLYAAGKNTMLDRANVKTKAEKDELKKYSTELEQTIYEKYPFPYLEPRTACKYL